MRTPDDLNDEFYIGYNPPMPPRLARYVTRAVVVITSLMLGYAVVLAVGHLTLDAGTFEFGQPRQVQGTIVERPYPILRLDGNDRDSQPWPLLVAPGKHGAETLVSDLDGRRMTLMGTRIYRGAHSMLEIDPASVNVAASPEPRAASPEPRVEGPALSEPGNSARIEGSPVSVTGEIVDSKCFLGVMVPGSGKTHSDCAALCLRGGIPPAMFVQDRSGRSALILLTGPSGEPISDAVSRRAGEVLSATGSLTELGGWLVLRTDPAAWHAVNR